MPSNWLSCSGTFPTPHIKLVISPRYSDSIQQKMIIRNQDLGVSYAPDHQCVIVSQVLLVNSEKKYRYVYIREKEMATHSSILAWRILFLPGESQGQRSLVGYRLWCCTESDMTEATQQQQHIYIYKCHEYLMVFPIQI